MRFTSWMLVILLFAVVAIESPAMAQPTDQTYVGMIDAMEEWLASKPKQSFVSPDARQVFEWRVLIESEDAFNRYHAYRRLLSEIGDTEFKYEYNRYNNRSLRLFILDSFPAAFNHSGNPVSEKPSDVLREAYDWYVANVNDMDEQFLWITTVMGFFTSFWGPDEDALRKASGDIARDVLIQYLALADHYLEHNRRGLRNVGNVYSDLTVLFSTASPEDTVLWQIQQFVTGGRAEYLTLDLKQLILDFVIPKYADRDPAVKIYAALKG